MSKKHKLILFDNDGTLNSQFSCWRYLQQPLGIFEPNGRELLEAHLEGKMNYEEFSKKNVALWKGIRARDFESIIEKIPLRDGAMDVLRYFKTHGYKVCSVSSGFDIWETVFKNRYSFVFDDFLSNHLYVDNDGFLTGEIDMKVTDDTPSKNKGEHLKRLAQKYGLHSDQTIMVGDGLGDINAFKVADVSFAAWPTHKAVAESASHVLDGQSLKNLLEFFNDGVYING